MYVIHACNDRMWYVNEFLIPSLHKQGIFDIHVWQDKYNRGNLASFLNCCKLMPDDGKGAWHLQDDVIISHDFKEVTQKYLEENCQTVVCGACCFSQPTAVGEVRLRNMWFSFQCIYIPNKLARDCYSWYKADFRFYMLPFLDCQEVMAGKGDDALFLCFLKETMPDLKTINLSPNIVDHVDYLIGGSTVNKQRNGPSRARLFEDYYLIDELEEKLKERGQKECIS